MNILFTVCGRAGSKGFKNKNLKLFNGIPLVYYTMSIICLFMEQHSNYHVEVVLNTDSLELQSIVKNKEEFRYVNIINRKEELAGDKVAKVDVIKDSYIQMKNKNDLDYDFVVDLDITSPMRTVDDIEMILQKTIKSHADLGFSVVKSRRNPYFNMVEKSENFYKKVCQSNFTTRQESPEVFDLNASIYVYSNHFLNKKINKTILEYDCVIHEMTDYLVLDIDSEEDFKMMEFLYPFFIENDSKLQQVYKYLKH